MLAYQLLRAPGDELLEMLLISIFLPYRNSSFTCKKHSYGCGSTQDIILTSSPMENILQTWVRAELVTTDAKRAHYYAIEGQQRIVGIAVSSREFGDDSVLK